jgi:hypothetical protein
LCRRPQSECAAIASGDARDCVIELREAEIDAMIRSGLLEKGSRNDANAVTQALYRLFDRIFRVTRNLSTSW